MHHNQKNMIPSKCVFEALGALEGLQGPLRPTGPLVAQKALGGPQGLCQPRDESAT